MLLSLLFALGGGEDNSPAQMGVRRGNGGAQLNFGLTSGHELRRAQHVPKSVTPTIDGAVAGVVVVIVTL